MGMIGLWLPSDNPGLLGRVLILVFCFLVSLSDNGGSYLEETQLI